MVQYLYAVTEDKQIVSAIDLAGHTITEKYTCISCENELTAKVNGKKLAPHFAHKIQIECNGETYLHKLAKLTFYNTYIKCINDGKPYTIELKQTKECRKYKSLLFKNCNLGEFEKKHNLINYYSNIVMEKRDGEFIPDLLLSSNKNPKDKIYIEIAVTHFLSEKKRTICYEDNSNTNRDRIGY